MKNKYVLLIAVILCFVFSLTNAQQDIKIRADQVELISGSGTIDLGDVYIGYPASYFFLIENVGNSNLTLAASNTITIGGVDPGSFNTSVDLSGAVIAPAELSAFDINVVVSTVGPKSIIVTVNSDDPDESVYTFTVTANGIAKPAECTIPGGGMENTFKGSLTQGLFSVSGVAEYEAPSGWSPGVNSIIGALFLGSNINVGVSADSRTGSNAIELFSDGNGSADLITSLKCVSSSSVLKGYYKFTGAPTDSAMVIVSTGGGVETNRTDANSDTLYIKTDASTYTLFEINVPYDINSVDSLLISLAITTNMIGVNFMVDDLELIATPGGILSQWSADPMENNPISVATNDQLQPKSVSDGSGGAIIVWRDNRNSLLSDIYAQRIDANGVAQWTVDGVAITTASNIQENPAIISDGNGGAIITWQDGRNGGFSQNDIYAQRIDGNGVVQWTTDGVAITTASDTQENPTIVSDGAGGAIIAWEDDRAVNNLNIFAQRVNSSGVVQWAANGILICGELRHQLTPIIISDGSGGAIITWADDRIPGIRQVYAQLVNASGVVQWTANGAAISSIPGFGINLVAIPDGSGGAIIAWENNLQPMSVQRIGANGVLQWSEIRITAGRFPSIIPDNGGGAIIAYFSGSVYAQRINSSGVLQWAGTGEVISAGFGNSRPTISTDGIGGTIIAWSKGQYPNFDIYGQRVNEDGIVQWTPNGVPISTAPNNQDAPFIISDGSNGGIVVWQDKRAGLSDIYAQKAYSDGNLCNTPPPIPGIISGPTSVLSLSSNEYSVLDVPTANSYSWSLPNGWSGSSTTNSINTTASASSGNISVTVSNGCGTSLASEKPITVNPNPQSITFGALPSKTFGDADFSLTATASSGLIVSFASNNTAVATVSGNIVTIVGAGSTTITASQAGNMDYSAASDVDQTLIVNQAAQTITFNSLSNKIKGEDPFDLSATSSSGLAVSYASSNTDVATVSGSTVTIVGAGTSNITASQPGDTNYLAAIDVIQTLTVDPKQDQTITFGTIAAKTMGNAPFTLSATASSGLAVAFGTTSTKITLAGSSVTLVSAGRATITASQAGNSSYNAAPNVDQSFCINPAKPTVTKSPDGETVTLTSSSTIGNQWFKDGSAISGEISNTFTTTSPGIYKVQVTSDDCVSAFSDDVALIITGDFDNIAEKVNRIYPNPGFDQITISLNNFEKAKPVSIKISDMSGRIVLETTGMGQSEVIIDLRKFVTGNYLTILQQNNKIESGQFIKADK